MLKAKIQKLKAIHNPFRLAPLCPIAVAKSKNTKIEGNSQQIMRYTGVAAAVAKSKNTKIEGNSQQSDPALAVCVGCC